MKARDVRAFFVPDFVLMKVLIQVLGHTQLTCYACHGIFLFLSAEHSVITHMISIQHNIFLLILHLIAVFFKTNHSVNTFHQLNFCFKSFSNC